MFSDSRCKNARRFDRPQNCAQTLFRSRVKFGSFTCKSVPDLVVHALNCARFCVVCTLNFAWILVVRMLDCAQFLLHGSCPFTNLAGTLMEAGCREFDPRPRDYSRTSLVPPGNWYGFPSECAFLSKFWIYLEYSPLVEAVITGHLRPSSMR